LNERYPKPVIERETVRSQKKSDERHSKKRPDL
jgi:hypothetical protein